MVWQVYRGTRLEKELESKDEALALALEFSRVDPHVWWRVIGPEPGFLAVFVNVYGLDKQSRVWQWNAKDGKWEPHAAGGLLMVWQVYRGTRLEKELESKDEALALALEFSRVDPHVWWRVIGPEPRFLAVFENGQQLEAHP